MKSVISFPVVLGREGKWHTAYCPTLDLATQGKTQDEVILNMQDMIQEYLEDPEIPKPKISRTSLSISITSVPVKIPKGEKHPEVAAIVTA
ncbi:MAG: hypothetical protein J4432_03560 [DPANN group archaeon]|nr:hypothetical protein [DPANN group archaeon]